MFKIPNFQGRFPPFRITSFVRWAGTEASSLKHSHSKISNGHNSLFALHEANDFLLLIIVKFPI